MKLGWSDSTWCCIYCFTLSLEKDSREKILSFFPLPISPQIRRMYFYGEVMMIVMTVIGLLKLLSFNWSW